ncbi:hypothetical protein [Streptomyces sp. NP-1717]|uniref:hypothetical protein n=1 Tax=Streptomyces sp. NP-1717 TaxID=2704470 RepID=UPI001F5C9C74|nr:hypothetical protein [Streptomyces sp. NP-1717]MCI3221762.1 hypothetical protein [Streptomyces sp. NP-1717]
MTQRTLLSTLGTASAAVALALSTAGAAHAVSYVSVEEGQDWGRISSGGDYLICDKEADSHQAYALLRWESGGATRLNDSNGSTAGCSGASTSRVSEISRFVVCEDIPAWPDSCRWKDITWGD